MVFTQLLHFDYHQPYFKLTGFSFHMRSYRPLLCCYFTPYKSITLARPDPVHSPLVPRCVPNPNHNLTSPHLLFLRNPQPGSAKVIGLSLSSWENSRRGSRSFYHTTQATLVLTGDCAQDRCLIGTALECVSRAGQDSAVSQHTWETSLVMRGTPVSFSFNVYLFRLIETLSRSLFTHTWTKFCTTQRPLLGSRQTVKVNAPHMPAHFLNTVTVSCHTHTYTHTARVRATKQF